MRIVFEAKDAIDQIMVDPTLPATLKQRINNNLAVPTANETALRTALAQALDPTLPLPTRLAAITVITDSYKGV